MAPCAAIQAGRLPNVSNRRNEWNKEEPFMNLLHLEYFREVAISEHVQKTGEKLHVSPSAISAGIRSLEQELGGNLFDRVGRNMRLNEFGKRFLPYVEEAFDCLQNGVDAVHAAQGRHLRLVSFSVQDGALWDELLLSFGAEHPDIHIRQLSQDPDRQGKLLEQANLDFILTDLDLNNSTLDHCDLFRDKLVLAVSKDHPLAPSTDTPRSIFDFQDDLFLFRPKADIFQQYVDQIFTEIGFRPSKTMAMEYMLRYRMFEKGPGVIITTQCAARQEKSLSDSAVCLEIKEFSGFSLVKKLYWKKSAPLSPSAAIFKEYLQNYPYLPKD